jgi:hypothetical protein
MARHWHFVKGEPGGGGGTRWGERLSSPGQEIFELSSAACRREMNVTITSHASVPISWARRLPPTHWACGALACGDGTPYDNRSIWGGGGCPPIRLGPARRRAARDVMARKTRFTDVVRFLSPVLAQGVTGKCAVRIAPDPLRPLDSSVDVHVCKLATTTRGRAALRALEAVLITDAPLPDPSLAKDARDLTHR